MNRLVVVDESDLESILDRVVRRALLLTNNAQVVETPEYFDLAQAAKFLRMSESSLYTHTSQRLVPFIKRGRRLRFKRSDLQTWLDGGRKKTRDEIAQEVGLFRKGGKP